jgi:hypothetical protein
MNEWIMMDQNNTYHLTHENELLVKDGLMLQMYWQCQIRWKAHITHWHDLDAKVKDWRRKKQMSGKRTAGGKYIDHRHHATLYIRLHATYWLNG